MHLLLRYFKIKTYQFLNLKNNLMKKVDWSKASLVIVISFIVATLSISHVAIGTAKTPPGNKFMATGHYYLDYFSYLGMVKEGQRGSWVFENPYSLEPEGKTFLIWWSYLAIGKAGKLFHLEPIASYWTAVFMLSFFISILIFKLIKEVIPKEKFSTQIIAFLFAIFGAPFISQSNPGSGLLFEPIDFWYAPSVIFKRFESVPHHLLGYLLILLTIYYCSRIIEKIFSSGQEKLITHSLIILSLLVATLTFYPYGVIILLLAFMVTISFNFIKQLVQLKKINLKALAFTLFILIGSILAGLFIKTASSQSALITRLGSLDVKYQYYPPLKLVFLTAGPLAFFSLFSLTGFFKKSSILKVFLIIFCVCSFILMYSPLAARLGNFNLRFITPVSYILMGVLSAFTIKKIAGFFGKLRQFAFLALSGILVIYFIFVNGLSLQKILTDKNIFSPITYIPGGIIDGFKFLDNTPDKRAVLTTPSQFLGIILPIYAGKKVYIGRHMVTADYEKKAVVADRFYRGEMNLQEAKKFFDQNNIGFSVLTSIEGYSSETLAKYNFLKQIYKNTDIVIYRSSLN